MGSALALMCGSTPSPNENSPVPLNAVDAVPNPHQVAASAAEAAAEEAKRMLAVEWELAEEVLLHQATTARSGEERERGDAPSESLI